MTTALRRTGFSLLAAFRLGGLALAPPAQSRQAPGAPAAQPAADAFTNALVRDLQGRRYQVTRGYPKLSTFEECEPYSYR